MEAPFSLAEVEEKSETFADVYVGYIDWQSSYEEAKRKRGVTSHA